MRVKCAACHATIEEAAILREAARIHVRMRKQRRGGRPKNVYNCRYCETPCIGRVSLAEHQAACGAAPSRELTVEDIAAMGWKPPTTKPAA
ncbi:MAG TPA: hypothetical protein VH639_24410 [Bryobacteraceae bacterium]